ncbi:MAG: hypothetical protein U5L10_03120 [Candidatus Moranbacteria bacterium]|nr:hypothetical protein [Candidatus Moranbacteria bacterium]
MKLNKKIVLSSLLGGAAVISAGWLASSADAYRGDYDQKGPNCTEERHEQMEQAFQNRDYQAWQEAMNGKGRVAQVVNEENFAKFAQARSLAQEGKYEEADEIREELGLRTKNGESLGKGFRNGNGDGRNQNSEKELGSQTNIQ